ncbi:Uu.00g034120.m01.CDS01 [Anthostomella pinea]|uniref:Uu.00g034120.m01.CDS01 n=1 Tax=Anthostomella pinea TaxID=933095 RepID=A0AAI8V8V1_9PEZI|nr:Uu.00g034120.m01.CDS01 [Anthostomella pinea]
MAPKLFLTGATGYIGGEALYFLTQAHPEYEYTLLVRDEERGKLVSRQYPDLRLVYGTLDDDDVIAKEAAAAEVVIHTADSSDNMPSAHAIAKGLSAGHTDAKPGYWIHVCGTGILQWYDQRHQRFGQAPLPEQTYHDIDDIERIVTLPHEANHRDVEEVVLAANEAGGIRTLIVSPPTIYGRGRGPVNQRSAQVPRIAASTLEHNFAPIQAPGLTEWDHVHIHDLGAFFVLATEAALDPARNSDANIFGPRAYFFLASGSHRWSDVARWVAEEAARQGFISAAVTKEVDDPRLGTNSKGIAARARKFLGWEPRGRGLREEIAETVRVEAMRMGRA